MSDDVTWARQARPPVASMLGRGLVRRCAWCGRQGAFFTGWFSKGPRCRRCGISWRRGDVGYEVGALAISSFVVLGSLVMVMGVWFVVTWPDVQAVAMLLVLGALAVVLPILLYPVSYTLWQAVDLLMRPPEPADFDHPPPT